MKARQGLSILAICFILFEAIFAFVPQTHAAGGPAVQNTANSTCNACTSLAKAVTVANVGDTIIVSVQLGVTAGPPTVSTITDGGDTFSNAAAFSCTTSTCYTNIDDEIWIATAATAGAVTVTASFSVATNTVGMELLDVSGYPAGTVAALCTASGVSQAGTSKTTSTSCAYDNTRALPVTSIVAGATLAGGAGTGYTMIPATGNNCNSSCGAEYSGGAAVSPTNFPFTIGSAGAGYLGAIIGVTGTSSNAVQTQTIGSCPTKDVSTFTMANLTVYFFSGTSLATTVPNIASTFLASITGSVSQTLYLSIYATPAAGGVSVSNPLTRLGFQAFTISSGTKNTAINWNTAVTPIASGATWAVGVAGDNKLVLNQSLTSGVTSNTFLVSFPGGAGFFNTLGSASTNLYLCATANYQAQVTTTTTTFAPATSTSTAFTTSTVTTIGANLFSSSSNWPVVFLILFLPMALLLGATKTLTGALMGLVVGAIIAALAGILPVWAFTGLIIALVAVAFIVSKRGD